MFLFQISKQVILEIIIFLPDRDFGNLNVTFDCLIIAKFQKLIKKISSQN